MKNFMRKTRLVHSCASFFGGLFRLVAALVDMAFNYLMAENGATMDPSV